MLGLDIQFCNWLPNSNGVKVTIFFPKNYKISPELHLWCAYVAPLCRGGVLKDVLGLEDTFWSPWPWPRRSSSWPWPRSLKSSKIPLSSAQGQYYFLKFCWKTSKTMRKTCKDLFLYFAIGDRLKKNFLRPFLPEKKFWRLFFSDYLCLCPWPRAFLSLASRGSVLRRAVLGLGFFLCPWPWPRALFPRLHLCHFA